MTRLARRIALAPPSAALALTLGCGSPPSLGSSKLGSSGDVDSSGASSNTDGSSGVGSTEAPTMNETEGGTTLMGGDRGGSDSIALPSGPLVFRGATILGRGEVDLFVSGDAIVPPPTSDDAEVVDVTGKFIVPAIIDSHVHLAYAFGPLPVAQGGVAVAIDMAAPLETLTDDPSPLRVLASGPMITAIAGYPTQSWGANGYGLEVATRDEALAAVELLAERGAALIKLPLTSDPTLDDEILAAVVERAHELDLKVAAHALVGAQAQRAADLGVDLLAHTPTERLSDATVQAWSTGAVVSTLRAFGSSQVAIDNLRRLEQAGATVLYGTDLGNTRTVGIDAIEMTLLEQADIDPWAAALTRPADYWGLPRHGSLEPGSAASFVIVDDDPRDNLQTLQEPHLVVIDGERLR